MTTSRSRTDAEEILAPDLGLLLAAELETWPQALSHDDSVRWIRAYRDEWQGQFARSLDAPAPSIEALSPRALRAALMWRVDLCIKLILHIGWEWTTARQLLDEFAEAITPERLGTARTLARDQFMQRDAQRKESHVSATEGEQPASIVLRASDDELDAALMSIYTRSRAYHEKRLALAQTWWAYWTKEARLLRWQASLLDSSDSSSRYYRLDADDEDGKLFETMQTLENLCQPPVLFETMQRDGADPDELLAPDPTLWPPTLARPISQFVSTLLASSDVKELREALIYWLDHTQLPPEAKSSVRAEGEDVAPSPVGAERHSVESTEKASDWLANGLVHIALGRYEEALAAFEHALMLRPTDVALWHHKANALIELGHYEEAQAARARASELAKTLAAADIQREKGRELELSGRYEEALAAYEQALVLNPDDVTTWVYKGLALAQLGRYEEALTAFDRALVLSPDDADAWYCKGLALDYLGRYEEALTAFERTIELRPDHADTWNGKGHALLELRRLDDALNAYEHELELEPNSVSGWDAKAQVLAAMERNDEALGAIERAIALAPDDAHLYNIVGVILMRAGRYRDSLAPFEKAMSLDPSLLESWQELAAAFRTLGREAEAQEVERKAQELGGQGGSTTR
jgi:tetratricopeptide (TPR) repeat protein